MNVGSVHAPGERARVALRRVKELEERRRELVGGVAATARTVATARMRAEEAAQRARWAYESAAARHIEASEVHLRAAAAHEQAAILAGDGEGDRHQDAAAWHRSEAELHQRMAQQDAASA